MEDSSLGSRRSQARPPRPESSASSHTRMTPSSSNSSSIHLPKNNTGAKGSSGVSLLQERLRERKVESARQNRRRSVDLSTSVNVRDVQSSPVKATMMRDERRPSSSGVRDGGMGVKQIGDQVSTLHKQNFDLKLELYHRRQRQEALEARLEAAEKQIAEQEELQEINDQLLAELEKRDNAVNEAVQVICELEEKVERLERERSGVKAFEATYEPGYFDDTTVENPSSSPPQYEKSQVQPRRSVPRMPSFLSETTQGTENLRSLYLPHEGSYSDVGLPKLPEEFSSDGENGGMNSPRLSVLSESSFVSVYGQKNLQLDDPVEDEQPRRHRASSSVEKWVDERPIPTATPARPTPPMRKSQFLSINDVLESPLQRLEKLKHTLEKSNRGIQRLERNPSVQEKRKSKELRKVFTDQGSFEQQEALPPTPDTISTNTLRHYQNSNDTLAQDRMKEGTFLNSISAFPTPNETYNAFQSTVSIRPRSAGETVTSRREGHGWDTPSEDHTDLASISSSGTYSQPLHPKRVMTPNLFSFSGGDWGRDMMYNDEPELPAHTRSRYQELRRLKNNELPRSDDTIRYDEQPQYGTVPIDTTPKPEVSDRRSSLLATTKLRKSNKSSINSVEPATPSPTTSVTPHKNRFSSLSLFRRGESSPATSNNTNTQTYQPTTQQPIRNKPASRTQSYFDQGVEDEEARATPPPIKRTRPGQAYRPSSAGTGAVKRGAAVEQFQVMEEQVKGRARRGSLNGGVQSNAGEEDVARSGGKKWFGLGRSGSQRRN
ncbi:uncharacterized protein PAC_08163 [Phialocephala subalpina]|uniref:Uncharacterized protein n=1 Tax=Phialocephala subalpina TaxID=576137 RepID=A0A1L7WZU2_9HELO|nr:uncharacterized protein PAC_08163 [Phialocephala subalpina]